MPAAQPRQPRWLGFGVAALAAISLGLGWWLGQRQGGGEAAAGTNPGGLQREVEQLRAQWESGEASQAEQQRLLELLVALDRRSEATPLLERLADQDAQRWSLRLLLAELRRDQGDLPGAERELRQLLSQRPDQVEGLQLMALIQLESGRSAEARSQLEAALQRATSPALKPEAMAIGLVLANVLQRTGQPGKAEAELIRLGTRFPSDPRPLLARAMLQQERGNTNAAQQVLAEARSRQSDPKAQEQLDQVAAAWGMAALKAPASTPTPAPPAGVENP
jgi:predicted Zn-dependent protease